MINKINFMGREECLTGPIKKAQKPITNYISDSAMIGVTVKKTSTEEIAAEKLNAAYKAAHAPYIEKASPKEDPGVVMDGQIL